MSTSVLDATKPNVLIVGYGNIGKHISRELAKLPIHVYDPNVPAFNERPTRHFDVAFICVPTELNADGSANISLVEEAVSTTDAEIIVIKSTVPVGTTNSLSEKYSKRIVFSPEFYGVTQHAPESPDFLILGGVPYVTAVVAQLYWRVKNGTFRILHTDTRTAELSKYMINSFLALKVTFCNEFSTIAHSLGIHYEKLREAFVLDPRVGDSHTFALQEQPYYDSHCFNKDIPALVKFAQHAPLMRKVIEINTNAKGLSNVDPGVTQLLSDLLEKDAEFVK